MIVWKSTNFIFVDRISIGNIIKFLLRTQTKTNLLTVLSLKCSPLVQRSPLVIPAKFLEGFDHPTGSQKKKEWWNRVDATHIWKMILICNKTNARNLTQNIRWLDFFYRDIHLVAINIITYKTKTKTNNIECVFSRPKTIIFFKWH